MPKFLMVITNSPTEGREDEYNDWYDNTHLHEICAIPGVISGRRFNAIEGGKTQPPTPYLTIYEIEANDMAEVMAEMGKRGKAGQIQPSPEGSSNSDKTNMWLYQAR